MHWLALALGLSCLLFPFLLITNIDRGFDLSDAAYYYLSIHHLDQISAQIEQVGAVWQLLSLPESIVVNRLALLCLMISASAWLTSEFARLHFVNQHSSPLNRLVILLCTAGAAPLYSAIWLPEPSYNTVSLLLSLSLIALSLRITRITKLGEKSGIAIAMAFGALSLLLSMTRQPNAAILIPTLVAFFLIIARPSPNQFLRLMGQALTGVLVGGLLVHFLVLPIPEIIIRVLRGLETWSDIGQITLNRSALFWSDSYTTWNTFFLPISAITLGYLLLMQRYWQGYTLKIIALLLVQLAASWIVYELDAHQAWTEPEFNARMGVLGFLIVTLVLLNTCLAIFVVEEKQRAQRFLIFAATLLLTAAYIGQVVGAHSSWFISLSIHATYPALVLLLFSIGHLQSHGPCAVIPAVIGCLLLQFQAWNFMSNTPYRLGTPLQAQTETTKVRHGKSRLKVDPKSSVFLEAIATAGPSEKADGSRPILIDLSGRLPGVTYHLEMHVPHDPWLSSGYAESQARFNQVLEAMDDTALQQAWVLDAADFPGRFETSVLRRRGFCLMRDYSLVFVSEKATYLNSEIRLYRPRPNDETGQPCEEDLAHNGPNSKNLLYSFATPK